MASCYVRSAPPKKAAVLNAYPLLLSLRPFRKKAMHNWEKGHIIIPTFFHSSFCTSPQRSKDDRFLNRNELAINILLFLQRSWCPSLFIFSSFRWLGASAAELWALQLSYIFKLPITSEKHISSEERTVYFRLSIMFQGTEVPLEYEKKKTPVVDFHSGKQSMNVPRRHPKIKPWSHQDGRFQFRRHFPASPLSPSPWKWVSSENLERSNNRRLRQYRIFKFFFLLRKKPAYVDCEEIPL